MSLAPAGADVLPGAFPNLLVNGSFGVATGSVSRIPPHNLREVADAALAFIDEPEIDVDGLMRHIAGPARLGRSVPSPPSRTSPTRARGCGSSSGWRHGDARRTEIR